MSENDQRLNRPEDTEGHGGHIGHISADAETAQGGDVQGHGRNNPADAETAEGDEVEGHVYVQEPGAPESRGT